MNLNLLPLNQVCAVRHLQERHDDYTNLIDSPDFFKLDPTTQSKVHEAYAELHCYLEKEKRVLEAYRQEFGISMPNALWEGAMTKEYNDVY